MAVSETIRITRIVVTVPPTRNNNRARTEYDAADHVAVRPANVSGFTLITRPVSRRGRPVRDRFPIPKRNGLSEERDCTKRFVDPAKRLSPDGAVVVRDFQAGNLVLVREELTSLLLLSPVTRTRRVRRRDEKTTDHYRVSLRNCVRGNDVPVRGIFR